jgi:hypothetical protein
MSIRLGYATPIATTLDVVDNLPFNAQFFMRTRQTSQMMSDREVLQLVLNCRFDDLLSCLAMTAHGKYL